MGPTKPTEFLRCVPDLVVETLSPATAHRDRAEKLRIYAANGVQEYWLVDPKAGQIAVFQLEAGAYGAGRTFDRGMLRSTVLAKLRLAVSAAFPPALRRQR